MGRLGRILNRGTRLPGVRTTRDVAEKAVTPHLRADVERLDLLIREQIHKLHVEIMGLRAAANDTAASTAGSLRRHQRQLDELTHRLNVLRDEVGLQDEARWNERVAAITSWLDDVVTRVDAAEQRNASRTEEIRAEFMYELRYRDAASSAPAGETFDAVDIIQPDKLTPADGVVRLNLGCGRLSLDGYVNVDMRALPGVDVVAPIDRLPFEPESVDEIFSAHLLEHFPHEELRRKLLPYWMKLLKPGGAFRAVVPDLRAMIDDVHEGATSWEDFRRVAYGDQEYEGDFHFNAFTTDGLAHALEEAGCTDVRVLASGRTNGICKEFEIEGRKPLSSASPAS